MSLSAKWLQVARSRLFVAVIVPALIGAAMAIREGTFLLSPFMFVVVGLVCAECSSMTAFDYRIYKKKISGAPVLPGNPVIPERILHPRFYGVMSVVTFIAGGLIFGHFVIYKGWELLYLAAVAGIAGYFYASPPFPFAYFATAFVPPAIAVGTVSVLGGSHLITALCSALPLTFSAAGTIASYRFPSGTWAGSLPRTRIVICSFAIAYLLTVILTFTKVLSFTALAGLLSSVFILWGMNKRIGVSSVEFTSLGVAAHTGLGLLIALSLVVR